MSRNHTHHYLYMWNTGVWEFLQVNALLSKNTKICTTRKFPAIQYMYMYVL